VFELSCYVSKLYTIPHTQATLSFG